MAKTNWARLARQKREALKAAGGDPVLASLRHHEDRLSRAVTAHDYSTQRDAQKAIADLRALLGKA